MTTDNSSLTGQKQTLAESWLKGDHVMAHIDARHKGVKVPEHLSGQPGLTLKLSYLFNGQMFVDSEGITAYLRFGSDYCECVLPWDAIWGLTSEKGELRLWPQSVPPELLMGVKVDPHQSTEVDTEKKRKPPKLKLVK